MKFGSFFFLNCGIFYLNPRFKILWKGFSLGDFDRRYIAVGWHVKRHDWNLE